MSTSPLVSELHFICAGKPGNPALIFLHAFPLSAIQWQKQFDEFSSDYFCVAPDLPGFGKAKLKHSGLFSFEAYVDYFEALLKELKIEKSIWIGLSMGGYLALRAYERLGSSQVKGLVLCDTKSDADGNEAKIKRGQALQAVHQNLEEFINSQAQSLLGESSLKNESLVGSYNALALQNSKEGIERGLVALLSRTDTGSSLAKILVPTLILVGEEDKVTPLKEAQNLKDKIPGSQLKVIPRSGHLSNLEQPEEFNRHLRAFLQK